MKRILEPKYSRDLNMIITKTDGENLVPIINNGDSYDYFISKDTDDLTFFGYIKENPSYKNYENLKNRYAQEEYLNNLEREYEKGSSEKYFNSTEELALEFEEVNKEFLALLYDDTIPQKKKYKNPIFNKRQSFEYNHPEISKVDVRICHLGYTSYETDEKGELKKWSHKSLIQIQE